MKKTKMVVAILLVVALMLPTSAYAATIDEEVRISRESSIYWVDNEERFANLFGNYEVSSVVQEISYAVKQNQRTAETDGFSANYSFDIDGNGPIAPVQVNGVLKEVRYTETLVLQEGIMRGSTEINGTQYKVNAVVQKEVNGSRVYTGVTMMPETAECLDDYIFFALGDPIISADMLPEWFGDDDDHSTISAAPQEGNVDLRSTTGYTFKGSDTAGFSSGFGISGNAQLLEFYHNGTINRSCVGVTSNTTAVTEYFEVGGIADTIVSSLEIGLQGKSSNVPYIVNVHEIPEDSDDGSDFIDTDYISYLTGFLSDVFDIAGSYFAPFEILLDALSQNNRVDVSVFTSGTDSSVTFDYSTNIFYMEDVKFDNAPMLVTFNLASADPAYGYFSAYSNIEYYTVYIPSAPSSMPVYLSIDGAGAATSYYYFRVK